MQGFQALIEKDWLAFGHMFQERCGHVVSNPDEQSPIFLQVGFENTLGFNCSMALIRIYNFSFSTQHGN